MKNEKILIITSSVGIAVNFILFSVKLYVAVSTNCISFYVDSLNNLADTFVALIALFGFLLLTKKVSKKYPFGLGRAEDVASFITSVVVALTAFAFLYTSTQRLMYPVPVWFSVKYAVIIGLTAFVKLALALFYSAVNKKHSSPVIRNLKLDSYIDFFITLSTVLSFTLTNYVKYSVDGFFGIAISIVLLVSGIKACVSSSSVLLGCNDLEACGEAEKIISAMPEVISITEIFCHSYGSAKVFNCNVTASVVNADDVFSLENNIKQAISAKLNAQITVGVNKGEINEQ